VEQSEELAVLWTLKAAEQGDPRSQYKMSLFVQESDPKEALEWLQKSAEQGFGTFL
jgi:TPR repeat protein